MMASRNTKRLRLRAMDDVIGDTEEEIKEIYKEVLTGMRSKFPVYFWTNNGTTNRYHAKVVVKHLIEDILKWSEKDVIKNYNADLLKKYKLRGMMALVFGGSPIDALENAYPGKHEAKEMQATCARHDDDIFQKESIRLRKLLNGLSHEEIVKQYTKEFWRKNRFAVLVHPRYMSITKFQLLDMTFPNEFREWEFTVPNGFWAIGENRKRATLWLMEKEGTKALTAQQFSDNGIATILNFGNGLDNTICDALGVQQEEYREKFHELLCRCHVNGALLAKELGISYKVLHSWKKAKRPTLFFVLQNYDKLVEISNRMEDTPEELYQKILEGKVGKFPSNYWKNENS